MLKLPLSISDPKDESNIWRESISSTTIGDGVDFTVTGAEDIFWRSTLFFPSTWIGESGGLPLLVGEVLDEDEANEMVDATDVSDFEDSEVWMVLGLNEFSS